MSFEADAVRFDYNGGTDIHQGWLGGTPGPFSTMLQTIGVKSIRVGGNGSELTSFPYPTSLDATHVNDFVNLIGANLIWTLPVGTRYNVSTYTAFAQGLINNQLGKNQKFQTVFEIGNEPDGIGVSSSTYQTRFVAYLNSLKSAINNSVLLGGASPAGSQSYDNDLIANSNVTGSRANIGFILMHNYPEGGSTSYPNASAAIDKMLSSGNISAYRNFYNGWAANAINAGFKPRLEETNSMFGGGFAGASNTFAAALWALDYLGFYSTTNLAGLNFHEGRTSGPNGGAYNPIDPVGIQTSYTLRGVGYALLAFKQFGPGRSVPVSLSNPNNVNVTAYAVLHPDNSESTALINKTHSSSTASSIDTNVTIAPGNSYTHVCVMYLIAPNSDPTTLTGITLGGQGVAPDGTWSGGYTSCSSVANGSYTLSLPHTSAAIVHFF